MKKLTLLLSLILLASGTCLAQTTAFTYQGKLASGGAAASGDYQFEFKLFDAATGTNQIGLTQSVVATVQNGSFSTRLDFGATAFPAGQDRWLEVSVRSGSSDPYVVLTPRQQVNSVPFAVRSLKATNADNATNAATAGIATTAQSVSGVVAIANGGTGSTTQNFLDLTSPQTVGGDKTFSETLTGKVVNAATQYNIGGNRILSAAGENIFAGRTAGESNRSGLMNSFFGSRAGEANLDGSANSFFGERSGLNSQGTNNSFFGSVAGQSNTTGENNTMIGTLADVGQPDLTFATAIGAGAVVSSSNTVVLGRSVDSVTVPGTLIASGLVSRFDLGLLATLRWDLLGRRSFSVGEFPRGVAFDGANIWVANRVANQSDGCVTKLRITDGAVLGSFPVEGNPTAIAFDGANIWVVGGSNLVTKLRARDGAPQGTFPAGSSPSAIAFDGANLWVANPTSNSVTKLQASDGAPQGSFPAGSSPSAIAFDGANIWVTNAASNKITKLRASDGAFLVDFNVGQSPAGVAFDGANLWVANARSNNVTKLASDGSRPQTFAVGVDPAGIAFDGANIWVVANGGSRNSSSSVTKLRASDGMLLETMAIGTSPGGIAFDGTSMWVANGDSGTVTKFPVGP
jgi:hypothetical protein